MKNIEKRKNLFFYYPFEFSAKHSVSPISFKKILDLAFNNIMEYRGNELEGYDTYICIKVNSYFYIYEWDKKGFKFRDKVNELLCSNYRNMEPYSLY